MFVAGVLTSEACSSLLCTFEGGNVVLQSLQVFPLCILFNFVVAHGCTILFYSTVVPQFSMHFLPTKKLNYAMYTRINKTNSSEVRRHKVWLLKHFLKSVFICNLRLFQNTTLLQCIYVAVKEPNISRLLLNLLCYCRFYKGSNLSIGKREIRGSDELMPVKNHAMCHENH